MKTSSLSVRAKLTLAFGSLVLIVICVSSLSVKALNDSHERMTDYVNGVGARVDVAQAIGKAVSDRAVGVRNLVLINNAEDVKVQGAAVRDAEQRVEAHLRDFNQLVDNARDMPEEARTLARAILHIESEYRPIALEIYELGMKGQKEAATLLIQSKCIPLLSALDKAVNDYRRYSQEHSAQVINQSNAAFAQERTVLVALCTFVALLAVVAGVLITRSLMRDLGAEPSDLAQISNRVASGDLSPNCGSGDCAKRERIGGDGPHANKPAELDLESAQRRRRRGDRLQ